ncbi:tetratricopeptide repeat protein [Citrifermentans bremense]|uniref:tetratricopeptide repeat protein n=1 Tax=Citrifermentans bremense TaxID=60035 RepID=UPI00040C4271|nr:tetratricopeptide repeat protein [Citrifermentans bremense]
MKKRRKLAKLEPQAGPQALPAVEEELSLWCDPLVHILLVLALGFAVYSNIVAAPFVFDDLPCLVNNPAIKDFSFFADPQKVFALPVNPDLKNNFILRPVAYFTFALNHALHGLDVRGYHVVNLLLHMADALLVYLVLWLTLRTPALQPEHGEGAAPPAERYFYLPFLTSLLFVCHPLQTQAVTYVVQRFVPLVAFFFLGSLALYAAGRLAQTKGMRIACYLGSLFACVLAMKSKENAFTLPAVIALYEFVFFRGAVTAARLARLVPFLFTMAIIPLKLMSLSAMAATGGKVAGAVNLVNFNRTSPWEYLMTQFGVITTYLRLLILPVNQNFDYQYPLQKAFLVPAVVLPLLLLLALAAGGTYLLATSRRSDDRAGMRALAGFGIWWFFITLSVESSVVPIDDVIFEHRAYLPSVGFFIALLAAAFSLPPRFSGTPLCTSRPAVAAVAFLVLASSVACYLRNEVWTTPVALWRDTVQKSPGKGRAHFSLGFALACALPPWHTDDINVMLQPMDPAQNQVLDEAVRELRISTKLDPKSAPGYSFLGAALMVQKKFDEAAAALATAAALDPKDARTRAFIGQLSEARGDLAAARLQYQQAISLTPQEPFPHLFLALLSLREGRHAEALKEYQIANRLVPRPDLEPKIAQLRFMVEGR